MKRALLALLLAAVATAAPAQTTVGTWQELATIVNRQARQIRDLEARVDMLRNDYAAVRDEAAALRKLDADLVHDLWLVIDQGNATLGYALAQLCAANAKIESIKVLMPWVAPFPVAPHTCPPAGPLPIPKRIVPPATTSTP